MNPSLLGVNLKCVHTNKKSKCCHEYQSDDANAIEDKCNTSNSTNFLPPDESSQRSEAQLEITINGEKYNHLIHAGRSFDKPKMCQLLNILPSCKNIKVPVNNCVVNFRNKRKSSILKLKGVCTHCSIENEVRGSPWVIMEDEEESGVTIWGNLLCELCWNMLKRHSWNSKIWIGEWDQRCCYDIEKSNSETGEPLYKYTYENILSEKLILEAKHVS
jgi:hypothetical protein